jgi:hypothetical protein
MSKSSPRKPLSLNTTFDSPLLHALGRQAANRCNGGGDFDALSAVILVHSALEGFLNEVAQLAQTLVRSQQASEDAPTLLRGEVSPVDDRLRTLALALRVAQDQRASLEYRYDLTWQILSGAPIDRGAGARQSLVVLTKLRNALVHASSSQTQLYLNDDPASAPDGFNGIWLGMVEERHQHPKFVAALRSMNLLADGDETQPWIHLVSTARLASWACDTVEQLAADLISHAPEGSTFRNRLQEQSLSGTIERAGRRSSEP